MSNNERNDKIECEECGIKIKPASLPKHLTSKRHKDLMNGENRSEYKKENKSFLRKCKRRLRKE